MKIRIIKESKGLLKEDSTIAPQNIGALAKSGGILIVSATYCGPCKELKRKLDGLNDSHHYIEIDKSPWAGQTEKVLSSVGISQPLRQDGKPTTFLSFGVPVTIAFSPSGRHFAFVGLNFTLINNGTNTFKKATDHFKKEDPSLSDEDLFNKTVDWLVSITETK